MRIWDTFLIGAGKQDLDLLECRLTEIGDCPEIYAHVIVEGHLTLTGLPKPLYYDGSRERFARWERKIRYVDITPSADEPGKQPGDAWAREHSSRQACALGMQDAGPGDLVIHGDVDEILSGAAVAELASWAAGAPPQPVRLRLRHYSFAVDWQQPWLWNAPSVARFGDVASFSDLREGGWPSCDLRSGNPAGWHLSWVGGPEAQRAKAFTYTHTEILDFLLDAIDAGKFYEQGLWHGHDQDGKFYDWEPMIAVDVDETWPRWVWESARDGTAGEPGSCPAEWFRPR